MQHAKCQVSWFTELIPKNNNKTISYIWRFNELTQIAVKQEQNQVSFVELHLFNNIRHFLMPPVKQK
nr:hypothetical protein [Tanacetum cinerariifolium]GEZ43000.1 hypothetical protein [Tanacetum cinerariifolium]